MRSERRSGFTLVEALVVIAVIVILGAILFPVFTQVRARARQSQCASHLREIAQAGLLYLADSDDRFPSCYRIVTPPYAVDPRTSLQPYIKNWDLFYCPERRTVLHACLDPTADFRPKSRCMGYGYNWGSGLGWNQTIDKGDGLVHWNGIAAVGVTLAEVAAPCRCFFYGDTNDYAYMTLLRDAMPGAGGSGPTGGGTNPLGMPYEPPRHRGGNNFAFVDGHVQWLRFPGGSWIDGGPWVVPDMSMYSRTDRWETDPIP
jgi:prepilin-type processing-associated H-X9-DG protein/prepilin-type N-terminal cleavage/methylation domain-containing protein